MTDCAHTCQYCGRPIDINQIECGYCHIAKCLRVEVLEKIADEKREKYGKNNDRS